MLVETIKGWQDDSELDRTMGIQDRETDYAVWVEWRHNGELVKRDCYVTIRPGAIPAICGETGKLPAG